MYVDDAGTPSVKDLGNYYVISGVIIEDRDLFFIERKVEDYRKLFFVKPYTDEEIHVHNIYHSEGNFGILSLADKYSLLNGIYQMIDSMPITVVSVGIDKIKSRGQYPNWNILNAAWTFLIERFDNFVYDKDGNDNGKIVVDISTNTDTRQISTLVKTLIIAGSNIQNIRTVTEAPSFFPSKTQHVLQIADAAVYCTLRNLNNYTKFDPYWNIIKNKLRKSRFGKIEGYGYKVFPEIMRGYMPENPQTI
jgi:hypothetical protein